MQESNLDGPTLPLTDDSLQKYVKIERYEKKMHHKHWSLVNLLYWAKTQWLGKRRRRVRGRRKT